jgi:hypothetical protein
MRQVSIGEKMKTRKGSDGILWAFDESVGGWIHADGPQLSSEKRANILSRLVKDKMEDKKDLSYGEAFTEVQKENPELSIKYLNELRKKK